MFFTKRTDRSGKLDVTGQGAAEIVLGEKMPIDIEVKFEDDEHRHHHVPCHHHHDKLEFCIFKKHDRFYLIIEWDVANCRIILWSLRS